MAGGLFGQPFVFNMKCIIFALACMALFLYKPNIPDNRVMAFVLAVIFVVAYIAMAWYDYYFDCRLTPLESGDLSLTGLAKPDVVRAERVGPPPGGSEEQRNDILTGLFHFLFVAPILVYIVVKRDRVNKQIYPWLGALAAFTVLFHGVALMGSSH